MSHAQRIRRPSDPDSSSDNHSVPAKVVAPPVAGQSSPGAALDPAALELLEGGFGHRFESVRVHDDADADRRANALYADAFTVGDDIFFARGVLSPDSPRAEHILAHEAAHVIQNAGATPREGSPLELGDANDNAERVAESAARSVLSGSFADITALEQSGNSNTEGAATVRRWPSLGTDWLQGAGSSLMGAGAGLLGGIGGAAAGAAGAGAAGAAGAAAAAGPAAAAGGTGAAAAGVAGAAGAAAGPNAKPAPDPKVVAASVASLNKAMAGWGTDENAIYATLKGKSPAEIAAIKEQYQKTTGTSLDAALKDEMSGAELQEAQAYLTGDPAKGAAAALVNAAAGWGTDEAKIMSTLKGLPPDQYLKVRKEFQERTGHSIDDMLKDELSGSELKDAQKELTSKFSLGLGKDVDSLTQKSSTLTNNINTLADRGWVVEMGVKGKGTFADRGKKRIVVDPDEQGHTADLVQSIAHESGHAMYTMDPSVPMGDLSKEDYVNKNTMRHLKDEGEATVTNMVVRNEILAAKGADIGIAGAKGDEYKKLYESFKDPTGKDRDKLREAIAKVYAKGEHPSTDTSSTYEDYYAKWYREQYDKNAAKKKD